MMTDREAMHKESSSPVREAVGVFHDKGRLDDAIADLSRFFPREMLSVLASEATVRDTFGSDIVDPHYAEENADTPRSAPVKPEEEVIGTSAFVGGGAYLGAVTGIVAAGIAAPLGVLASVALLGAVGGGGLAGGLAEFFRKKNADHLDRQIEAGGLLLWVGTPTADKEKQAVDILRKHGASDVAVHDIR